MHYNESTIAAISTPYGTGGIGIIRISGPKAFEIGSKIFIGKKPFSEIKSHTIAHGKIVDPKTGQMLDDVLLFKMKGPNTYTAEDVVEISGHGGIVVLKNILQLVLSQGARAAEPGEFTKRAFINGRIDLAQAEAVIDLINSKTNEGSKAAAAQLEGRLSERIKEARGRLIEMIAHIEAIVDYPEHDIENLTGGQIYEGVKLVREKLHKIAEGFDTGRMLREGITAAIIGRPNAGKSSLLNVLSGSNRAIVTEIPGTTRDIIEEYVNVNGIPVRFLDTAGIRSTYDPVESIGVKRAQKAALDAELVIVVIDGQIGLNDQDIEILKVFEEKRKILIINKTDIASEKDVEEIRKKLNEISDAPIVIASMEDGTGMEELLSEIEAMFLRGQIDLNNEVLVTNERHRQLLDKAITSLDSAAFAHESGLPLDLVTIDLKESADYLGQITGESVSEDVVNAIFERFCIGK